MAWREAVGVAGGVRVAVAFVALPLLVCGRVGAEYTAGMEAYRKAQTAYAAQQYDQARRWATQAIRADPASPHAHALLGDLHYLAHDLDGARAAWAEALRLEPRLLVLQQRLDQLAHEQALEQGQVAGQTERFVIRVPARAERSEAGGAVGAQPRSVDVVAPS